MATEAILPPAEPALEPVTVTLALELTWPLKAVALAEMTVVPGPTAVATPEELMVATEGTLEAQVTPEVMSCVVSFFALPYEPTAVNWAVWPTVRD